MPRVQRSWFLFTRVFFSFISDFFAYIFSNNSYNIKIYSNILKSKASYF